MTNPIAKFPLSESYRRLNLDQANLYTMISAVLQTDETNAHQIKTIMDNAVGRMAHNQATITHLVNERAPSFYSFAKHGILPTALGTDIVRRVDGLTSEEPNAVTLKTRFENLQIAFIHNLNMSDHNKLILAVMLLAYEAARKTGAFPRQRKMSRQKKVIVELPRPSDDAAAPHYG